MIKIKHSIRVFYRNIGTTFLVLISLSSGLTAYVFISSRVSFHRSFDTHISHYTNIYRVVTSTYHEGNLTISQPRTQRKLGETLQEVDPAVKQSGFICSAIFDHYTINDQTFTNDHAYHCSGGFVNMFPVKIIQGRTSELLTRPNLAVVSESFARKYFGNDDPIGQIIEQYPGQRFEIEAVFRDFPINTHFIPEILISFHDNMFLPPPVKEDWGEFVFTTYLELDSHADIQGLENEITQLCTEKNNKLLRSSDTEYRFQLQPLGDIHTRSHLKNELGNNVRADYLNILQLVSIFILVISGFNYIYFTFIRLSSRSKQYGLRRVLGAAKRTFLFQFIAESVVIHVTALIISILILLLAQHLIRGGGPLNFTDLTTGFWLNLALILIMSAILNPLILFNLFSRNSTLSLLTGTEGSFRNSFSFRQLFTILQFAIIIFLTSSILGMGRQMRFLETKDKGMEIRDKLVINTPSNLRRTSRRVNDLDAFEKEIARIAGVRNVSTSNNTPGDVPAFSFSASLHPDENGLKIAIFLADSSYLETFGIRMAAGDGFHLGMQDLCIINRTCMSLMGFDTPEEILGTTLYLNDDSRLQTIECSVSGVCEDFNFTNVKELPDPVILLNWAADMMYGKYILATVPGTDKQQLLSQIEPLFAAAFPNYAFDYYWVEDHFNKQFEEDISIRKTLQGFALITLLLGVLSLLSMVRQYTLIRTKEIGIRKVNGATALDILSLLNIHFIKWIAIALIIGIPPAWIYLSHWLDGFAYRQPASIWIFVLSGGGAMFIGALTVTLQSLHAARRNPVDAIKYE